MCDVNLNKFGTLVTEALSIRLGSGYVINIKPVTKNNGVSLLGVTISDGANAVPIIYLNNYYERYRDGADIDDIAEKIVSVYNSNRELPSGLDVTEFTDWEKAQKKLSCRLVNSESNKELLQRVPSVAWQEDLAVIFVFNGSVDDGSCYSIVVTNDHMTNWGVDTDELYKTAISNLEGEDPEIISLFDAISSLVGQFDDAAARREAEETMFVLSSRSKCFGAKMLLHTETLKKFAEEHSCDPVIIPSSVHEVILLTGRDIPNKEALCNMICEVNRTQVLPEEVLSDHPYVYHRAEGVVTAL
jgi:hypothetical protein